MIYKIKNVFLSIIKRIKSFIRKVFAKKRRIVVIPMLLFFSVILGFVLWKYVDFRFLSTSIRDIDSISDNLNNVVSGDIIKYNINGVDEWRVLNVDKANNSVQVISNNNTTEIEINKDNVNDIYQIFQNEADKYYDNNYVIDARTVIKSDLDYNSFAFSEHFWFGDASEEKLSYTGGFVDKPVAYNNSKIFLVPVVNLVNKDFTPDNYVYKQMGDDYEISLNGIDSWSVYRDEGESICIYPKDPIEIKIDENTNAEYLKKRIDEFRDNVTQIEGVYWLEYNDYDINYIVEKYHDFISQLSQPVYFYRYSDIMDYNENNYYGVKFNNTLRFDGNQINYDQEYVYKTSEPLKFGYRPVLTLKFGDKDNVDRKTLDGKIKIGDYVNYSANNYDGWRVLSIDNEKGTVDIISSGIVENLQLTGVNDYNNYESILQAIVDKYKNGENVISSRAIKYSDHSMLDEINDDVKALYWTNNKSDRNFSVSGSNSSSPYTLNSRYCLSVMGYNLSNLDSYGSETYNNGVSREWITIYLGDNDDYYEVNVSDYNGVGYRSYTAGIRPIVTIKVDGLKKLDSDTVARVQKAASELNSSLYKHQNDSNKLYYQQEKIYESSNGNDVFVGKTNKYSDKDDVSDDNFDSEYSGSNVYFKNNGNVEYNNYQGSGRIYIFVTILIILLIVTNVFLVLSWTIIPKKIKKILKK